MKERMTPIVYTKSIIFIEIEIERTRRILTPIRFNTVLASALSQPLNILSPFSPIVPKSINNGAVTIMRVIATPYNAELNEKMRGPMLPAIANIVAVNAVPILSVELFPIQLCQNLVGEDSTCSIIVSCGAPSPRDSSFSSS